MRSAIFSSSLLLLSAVLAPMAVGTPTPPYSGGIGGKCENPTQRKEWRALSDDEKKSYIDAVKCLHEKPAISSHIIPGAVSRFDDFQGVHIVLAYTVHYVGRFLPWHRYHLALYEKALTEECGYKGGHPYWDWTLDAHDVASSPIFDPVTGFGGNGIPSPCMANGTRCFPGGTGGGCVQDGPFKDHVVHMGPWNFTGTNRNDHCLARSINPKASREWLTPEEVEKTLDKTTFEDFIFAFEGIRASETQLGQHTAGHAAVGGTLADFFASPGEPLFYMHHASVDWIWSIWQSRDHPARLEDISGILSLDGSLIGNTTIETPVEMGLLGPEVTIADLMDIQGGYMCYEYV